MPPYDIRVYDFTGVYRQSEYALADSAFVDGLKARFVADFRDLPGTAFYCDDAALDVIRGRLAPLGNSLPFNLIDSGDYHYMSAILAERITRPYALILMDKHPDMQAPAFGDILSCGGWVRWLLERYPLLQKVLLIGTDPSLLSETSGFPGRVEVLPSPMAGSNWDALIEGVRTWLSACDLPIYLSIDKDVLAKDYALTDWDQGTMTLDTLLDICSLIKSSSRHGLLSVDICGELSPSRAVSCAYALNACTNRAIISTLK